MSNRVRDNLEAMLARGQDNALLRFSLGQRTSARRSRNSSRTMPGPCWTCFP
jgi:hypothetical protein